jgi:DNA (cytosine-5)-methyltransferase 1
MTSGWVVRVRRHGGSNLIAKTRDTSPAGTFVSLYSGAGGLDIGFQNAGFTPVWANDIDPVAVETYNSLFPGHTAHAGDIRRQDLPERGSADLVIGGPPCQGFSVAGKMDPNDPRSRHVWDFMGVVKRIEPRAFVMENVKALARNRRWSGLLEDLTLTASEELGYVTTLLVLNSSHFGVPQNRERMFLIGVRDGAAVSAIPTTAGSPPTVRSTLETLPRYGEPGNDTLCPAKVTPARQPVLRRSPFAGMLFNGQGRPLNLDAPAPTLPATMGGNRTPIIDQHQLEHGGESWVVGYHGHLWSGGAPYASIPGRLRRLTVEEAAAIQTFPPEMRWHGRLSQQFRQIGNAVPPQLAFHVALAVRAALAKRAIEEPLTAAA